MVGKYNLYKMERTFYKLDIQGIVYLVDPATAKAYTYDLADPTEIGKVVWVDMKSNPTIELLPTWKEILAAKIEAAH
jgi:hypothetical protein